MFVRISICVSCSLRIPDSGLVQAIRHWSQAGAFSSSSQGRSGSKFIPHHHHFHDKLHRPVVYEKLGKVDVRTIVTLINGKEYLDAHIHKMETTMSIIEKAAQQFGPEIEVTKRA